MKLNIGKKYVAAFGVLSLVVTAVITVSFIALLIRNGNSLRRQIEKTEREIYEESQGRTQVNIVNYLSSYLFVPLYQLDVEGMNRLIKDMKEALPIDSLLIVDPSGNVLTDGTKENRAYGSRVNVGRLKEDILIEDLPGGQKITFAIRAGTYIAGYGQVVFSHAPLRSAIRKHDKALASTWHAFTRDFMQISILAFAVVLLLAALLSLFFSRTLSRPLIALKEATNRVARGDLSHQVAIDSKDEIGELGASFNRMVFDLKTSTERLKEANEKLRALDRLKSEFITVASHELRTPITSVQAFAELILMKPAMPAEKKTRFIEIIRDESRRLTRLINDILDITRIEAGRLQYRMSRLSIEEVIRHSVAGIRPLAEEKDLNLDVALDPDLPSIEGDKDRLIQVVTNVLSNAVKFTPPAGHIRVRAYRDYCEAPAVTIAISDTGMGIPPESLDLIFEKFHRAGDALTRSVEGTGLGLAIARQIMEHHGGVIYAISSPGSGSTFVLSLPLDQKQKILKTEDRKSVIGE